MSIPRNLGNFADNVNANGKVEVTGINATGTPSASTALLGNGTWGTVTTSPAGSTGQVQYNNAGAFGAISSGTSGQVLTSAGAGAAPTWASPAAGGSWIYLSTVTASNSATVTIDSTFNSTYQVYALVVSDLRGQNGSESLNMICGFNSIGYVTNEYRYHLNQSNSSSTSYSASATTAGSVAAYKVMSNVSAETFDSAQFIMYIHNPSSTTSYKGVYSIGVSQNSSAITQNMVGWCTTGSNYALTGLRFYMGSGNIVNGTFRLYGIKNN